MMFYFTYFISLFAILIFLVQIFTQYEKHRRLLLDDILASIARLPSSKRSLRTFKLSTNSEEHIQMLTALVLQLIQCVTYLPDRLAANKTHLNSETEEGAKEKLISVSCVISLICINY